MFLSLAIIFGPNIYIMSVLGKSDPNDKTQLNVTNLNSNLVMQQQDPSLG